MKILIIGATSAIAKATARIYAERGQELFLIARNEEKLDALSADLTVRGAQRVGHAVVDLNKYRDHGKAIDAAFDFLATIDIALICHGSLPDQDASEINFKLAETLQESKIIIPQPPRIRLRLWSKPKIWLTQAI